jgi:hypothetical protein
MKTNADNILDFLDINNFIHTCSNIDNYWYDVVLNNFVDQLYSSLKHFEDISNYRITTHDLFGATLMKIDRLFGTNFFWELFNAKENYSMFYNYSRFNYVYEKELLLLRENILNNF